MSWVTRAAAHFLRQVADDFDTGLPGVRDSAADSASKMTFPVATSSLDLERQTHAIVTELKDNHVLHLTEAVAKLTEKVGELNGKMNIILGMAGIGLTVSGTYIVNHFL